MSKTPNILWICTDQQRYDTLGCYGNKFVKTPNIDKLASRGVKFNNAYCQSPVCSPSRASFLTGRYPSLTKCRQNGQIISKDEKLVSKLFAENGYNCGLSGKLHIAPCHPDVCKYVEERIDDGYTYFEWSHHIHAGPDLKQINWPNNAYHLWLAEQGQEYSCTSYENSEQVEVSMPEEYHHTTWAVNKAMNFIKANTEFEKPWFFSLNLYDPHHAFDPPKEYLERYLDKLDELPMPNFVPGELDNKLRFQQSEYKNGSYNSTKKFQYDYLSERDHKLVKAAYWAMCDLIDHQVGRLMDYLEEKGQLENTIIIYMSDHGEMLGDHGIYLKGPHCYDCTVKVPLIMSWKDHFLSGVEKNALVELTDLAPTLMKAADMPIYEGMQGQHIMDVLTTDKDFHRTDVISEYMNSMSTHKNPNAYVSMIRDEKYKLVCAHGIDDVELYDLIEDPNETYNLAYKPEYAEIKYKLMKRMCDRKAFQADPLPKRAAAY